ncbi:MAG: hypothetical protein H0V51_10585, partial [Chloroflexi bacterium]|nr:hypothetical protein [Chloroflexota bacterium]
MPDLVRLGLLLLSLGALVTSSVILVSPWRLAGAGTLLALWIVGAGQVVLLAEGLSLLHALDWPGFLAGHLLVLGGSAGLAARRPPADRWRALSEVRDGLHRLSQIVLDRHTPWLPLLLGAVLLVGLTSTVLALLVPPNNFDSLMYHMSRVGYYLQFRSLDHYPTTNLRQVTFPANAELLVLWTVAFLGSDRLANTVQLVAWVVTTVGVYGLGRRVGLGAAAALLGAGAFALLPQVVLQSTSAHND